MWGRSMWEPSTIWDVAGRQGQVSWEEWVMSQRGCLECPGGGQLSGRGLWSVLGWREDLGVAGPLVVGEAGHVSGNLGEKSVWKERVMAGPMLGVLRELGP